MEDTALITFLALAVVGAVWLGAALFAFWRSGRLASKLRTADGLAHFINGLLQSGRRHPIWIWPNGSLQMAGDSRALLGLADDVVHLDQLSAGQESGLPLQVVDLIRQALEDVTSLSDTISVDAGQEGRQLQVDMQIIKSPGKFWPKAVVWLEETFERRTGPVGGARVHPDTAHEVWQVYDRLPVPVWLLNSGLELIDTNAAYIHAVEASNLTQVLRGQRELLERRPDTLMRRAMKENITLVERLYGNARGRRRLFDLHAIPLSADRLMCVALDRSGEEEAMLERARVIEAQSETLNRLRSPVAVFGADQHLRFYNQTFAMLTQMSEAYLDSGVTHGELLDAMHAQHRLPEQVDYRSWKDKQLSAYTDLITGEEEIWHLADGTTHRIVTQPYPFGGLLVLAEDITDRLALERSYNTLMAVQQQTLDNMHESVAVVRQDGRLRFANRSFRTSWQITEDEQKLLEGEGAIDMRSLVNRLDVPESPVLLPRDHQPITQIPAWVSDRKSRTGRYERASGKVVEYAMTPLPNGDMLLSEADVTDSVRIEKALRDRSQALEAADRLRSQFITSMSYELRTPLNTILGFSEVLDMDMAGPLNDKQRDYVRSIVKAAGGLKTMISDVLDLAVIEAGAMALDLEQINLSEPIDGIFPLASELAEKNSINLIADYDDMGTLVADSRRLKQALYNMISGAVNLCAYGSDLIIRTSSSPDAEENPWVQFELHISDTAMTIAGRDNLIHVLDTGGVPPDRRTTGLDFALTRSIIDLHRGRMIYTPINAQGLMICCRLWRKPVEKTDF